MTYANSVFKKYEKKQIAELRFVTDREIELKSLGAKVGGFSISDVDLKNGSPKKGDMIARNPKNRADKWLVSKEYFEENFKPTKETMKELIEEYCFMEDIAEYWINSPTFKTSIPAWAECYEPGSLESLFHHFGITEEDWIFEFRGSIEKLNEETDSIISKERMYKDSPSYGTGEKID